MTQDRSLKTTERPCGGRDFRLEATPSILIGGAIGGASYVCYATLFEQFVMPSLRTPGAPMLSYGQQCGVMMVVAFYVGCSIGLSLVARRWWLTLIAILFPVFIVLAISNLWSSNFAVYGADPSDWIVFVPVVVGSVLCVPLNIVLSIVGYSRRARRRVAF
jgi:hypothetical protein